MPVAELGIELRSLVAQTEVTKQSIAVTIHKFTAAEYLKNGQLGEIQCLL